MYPSNVPPPYPNVASHMPVLWTLLLLEGISEIYEFGAGDYSTSLLGTWSKEYQKNLMTGEDSARWKPLPYHPCHYVGSVEDMMASMLVSSSGGEALVFVDCDANKRRQIVNEALDGTATRWLVVHDTEPLSDRAYDVRRPLLRWPDSVSIKCPFHGIETTVACRVRMSHETRASFRILNDNPGLHGLRWHELDIFIRSRSQNSR